MQAGMADRRASMRSLVALVFRARLSRSQAGRVALYLGLGVALVFGLFIVYLGARGGHGAPLEGLVAKAAPWCAWLAGAPAAFAAASDLAARDRHDGIDVLAAGRGLPSQALDVARGLGAMLFAAFTIGAPLVALALVSLAFADSASRAVARLGLVVGAAAFAVVAGVTLGGLGALSGRIGRERGRLVLLASVVIPWIVADWAGRGVFSIAGALSAMIDLTLRAGGAGA